MTPDEGQRVRPAANSLGRRYELPACPLCNTVLDLCERPSGAQQQSMSACACTAQSLVWHTSAARPSNGAMQQQRRTCGESVRDHEKNGTGWSMVSARRLGNSSGPSVASPIRQQTATPPMTTRDCFSLAGRQHAAYRCKRAQLHVPAMSASLGAGPVFLNDSLRAGPRSAQACSC